jgi:hypothetical protein
MIQIEINCNSDALTNRVAIAIVRLNGGLDNGQSDVGSSNTYHAFPRVDTQECFVNLGKYF